MVNPIHQHLSITICDNAQDAIAQGFNWRETPVKPIEIQRVIVVRNGTQQGNATVDLLPQDETGQQFVCMVTANLLKAIPA